MWNKVKCFFDFHKYELVTPFGKPFVSELHKCGNCKQLYVFNPNFGSFLPYTSEFKDLMNNPAYRGESVSVPLTSTEPNDQ